MVSKELDHIDEIWLVVGTDDTGEGISAYLDQKLNTWVPLLAADPARLESITATAKVVAQRSGQSLKLVKFDRRTEVSVITGE